MRCWESSKNNDTSTKVMHQLLQQQFDVTITSVSVNHSLESQVLTMKQSAQEVAPKNNTTQAA